MTRIANTARTAVLIAVASGILALGAPAFAADDAAVLPQGQLNLTGTDFTSAKSVDRLKSHLQRVALEICMPGREPGALPNIDERKCIDSAKASGIAQIDTRYEQAMRSTTVNVASAQETHVSETHPAH